MSSPSARNSNDSQPAGDPVFFPCSNCGKTLKRRRSLTGKKIQCPHCRAVMLAPALPSGDAPSAPIWRALLPPFALTVILWSTFILNLHNLDHTGLTRWDEVFHAVVAQNTLKHPLKPTLVDAPYLPYDHAKWGENHVWLHKPILPFWQIALSFALFGVNTFALRLPAAILSTGSALLTYLIGKELFDRRTALIAAALQAANPFLVRLVHGYQFADNVDIALLFWVEVGFYFLVLALRTGAWRFVILAGVAQGLAYLSKSYLAAIIFGVALTAWLLPICRLSHREQCQMSVARLAALFGATLLTIAPWMTFCMLEYPDEFWHEHAQVWRHLHTNVEQWAAPWDRVAFDYMIAIHGVFYTPILVASIALVGNAFAKRHTGLWLMYAWSLGVVIPHLFAVTKTPSATLLALPAFLLLLGHLISEASRGERWPLAALTAILFMCVVTPAVVNNPGHGYPSPRVFGGVMRRALWVIYHVAGALPIAAVLAVAAYFLSARFLITARVFRTMAIVFCGCVLTWFAFQTVSAAWKVTNIDFNDAASVEVGTFAREHLGENAVLICESRNGYENLTTMFYADRTCYLAHSRNHDELARKVTQAGGIAYIVSYRNLPYPAAYVSDRRGPNVYLWQANERAN